MQNNWLVTLGDFEMRWREPLSEDDIRDIEQLSSLAVRGMRRRIEPSPEKKE